VGNAIVASIFALMFQNKMDKHGD